jgi:NAD(P)-dependent dehydrogenase (short-subunit alcohol dehydrogenase family)
MDDLTGKVAVVTGGASGIGLAMATRFLAAGVKVVLGDIDEVALDAAAANLEGDVIAVRCDVTSPESNVGLRDAAIEAFGGVHVACLNAGVAPSGLLLDTPLEDWRWLLDVNVLGPVHGMRAFAPGLVEQGEGHLVFTASGAGLSSATALGAYSATKHAVVGLAATLRDELAGTGVGVSVLCPGVLKTAIFDNAVGHHVAPRKFIDGYLAMMEASPDPSVAAEAVHDAVLANRLFVLPSPEINWVIESRLDEVREALL